MVKDVESNISMTEGQSHRFQLFIRCVCACVILVIGFIPFLSSEGTHFFSNGIEKSNMQYLEDLEKNAVDNMLTLTEIQSALAVVKSSDVGVSFVVDFQVGLGRELEPLSKMVDKALLVSVLEIAVAITLQLIVFLSAAFTPILFFLAMISLAYFLIFYSRIHKDDKNVGLAKVFIISFMCVHIYLPYSIHASGSIGKYMLADLREESVEKVNYIHQDLISTNGKKGFKEEAKRAVKDIDKAIVNLPHKIESVVNHLVQRMIVTLFEGVLFPTVMFGILWVVFRRMLHQVEQKYLYKEAEELRSAI